jgi:hypothetical protein
VELPIATGFYEDASKPISAQECTNLIPQVPQTQGLSQAQLIGTPGIVEFANTGTASSRGAHVMGGIAYSVNGNSLFRVDSDGTTTNLGAITGTGRVSIADNGLQICVVVPNIAGYIYSASGGFVQITDTDYTNTLGPSEGVVHKDGYFVHYKNVNNASNKPIFFISSLNDGTAYNALDFGTAEVDPDLITGLHVNRNILYVAGAITNEPFQNVGGDGFPFQRISGGVIQKGISSKFTLVDFDNTFVGIGGGVNEQPAIWRFSGASAQKISTAAIDKIIQDSTDDEIAGMYATVYAEGGGYFVNFHFKDRVMTYDAASSALRGAPTWHERKSKDNEDRQIAWRVNGIIDAYGYTLVADSQDGRIGRLDKSIYDEYGIDKIYTVASMPFHGQGNKVKVSNIELTCESGVGLGEKKKSEFPFKFPYTFGDDDLIPGVDPVVLMQFSDDGGFSWSNGTSRRLGKEGEHKKRQIWRRQGQFSVSRVYRFMISDPVKATIIKLEADFR